MTKLRTVLTQLCEPLLEEPHDTLLSHCTINIALQSISGFYRVYYDGAFSITTFCITREFCIGSILQEPDGHYWEVPYLTTWSTLAEYPVDIPPRVPLAWRELLGLFATVEIIQMDRETGRIITLFLAAAELAVLPELDTLLVAFEET